MNNKIAIGLITGALIAVAIGLLTVETKYYSLVGSRHEISKGRYEQYKPRAKKEKTYSPIFMALGFLGGMGIGYLIGPVVNNNKKTTGKDIKH